MEALKRFIRNNGIIAWIIISVISVLVISLFVLAIFKGPGYAYLAEKLTLPLSFGEFIRQPWSLFSYWAIIHPGLFIGILVSLWILWSFARIFRILLGDHRLRNLIIFGIFINALIIMLVGAAIQGATHNDPLLGKSPHLYGLIPVLVTLVAATITFRPNFPVNLFFLGMVPIVWIGLFIIAIELIAFRGPFSTAGLAVLISGGIGFAYARLLREGTDITGWLDAILDGNPAAAEKSGKTARTSKKKVRTKMEVVREDGPVNEDEINRILDKINKVGYEKLTRKEKETLAKYSEGN